MGIMGNPYSKTPWPKNANKAADIISDVDKAIRKYRKLYPDSKGLRCHEKAEVIARFYNLKRIDGYIFQNEHSWVKWDDKWIIDIAVYHVGVFSIGLLIYKFSAVGLMYNEAPVRKECKPRKVEVNRVLRILNHGP